MKPRYDDIESFFKPGGIEYLKILKVIEQLLFTHKKDFRKIFRTPDKKITNKALEVLEREGVISSERFNELDKDIKEKLKIFFKIEDDRVRNIYFYKSNNVDIFRTFKREYEISTENGRLFESLILKINKRKKERDIIFNKNDLNRMFESRSEKINRLLRVQEELFISKWEKLLEKRNLEIECNFIEAFEHTRN